MKTILVVDDNAICREPIAAMLRLAGYQTLEAANGLEALNITHTQQPDLILLDVAMPVMDGLTCVIGLRSRPETAHVPVVMLTGTSDRHIIVEAAKKGIAGFLLKSKFSTVELISRVETLIGRPDDKTAAGTATRKPNPVAHQAAPKSGLTPTRSQGTETPQRLTRAAVLHRLGREIELRSIKPVLEYVIALTRSSASTIEDIAAALRQDQALALRVLRIANSSFNRRGRSAKNLIEATQRIGLTAVRNTAFALLAIDHFELATESGLIPMRFWEHSLATGVLAELLGETLSCERTDQLFLAGLLHDVGRMVLATVYPAEYSSVLARAAAEDVDVASVEQHVFELNHVEITRQVLARWNLPSSIIESAALHDSPIDNLRNGTTDPKGVLVVALANRLAHALVLGDSGNARLLPYHEHAAELGLDRATIDRITNAALQKMADTELFYEAQFSQHFREPMAAQIEKQFSSVPRVSVLATDAPVDVLSVFFRQLHCLESKSPSVAIILAHAPADFARYLPALKAMDGAAAVLVPVIIVATDESMTIPAEWKHRRKTETLALPCNYSKIMDAVVRCSKADVSTASSVA